MTKRQPLSGFPRLDMTAAGMGDGVQDYLGNYYEAATVDGVLPSGESPGASAHVTPTERTVGGTSTSIGPLLEGGCYDIIFLNNGALAGGTAPDNMYYRFGSAAASPTLDEKDAIWPASVLPVMRVRIREGAPYLYLLSTGALTMRVIVQPKF